MPSLPLEYPQFHENQRAESADFSALGSCAQANLYLTLKNLLGTGWLQPGVMERVGPGMECFLRAPAAAITAEGIAILAADWACTPSVGDATHPRIDLVSIGYLEADTDSEARPHKDPDTGVVTTPTVATRVEINRTADVATWMTLTEGTPAATPARPATPANHVALWEIYVPALATTLSASSFTLVASGIGLANRIAVDTWLGDLVAYASPYVSPTIIEVETPTGAITLFLTQIHFKFNGVDAESVVLQIEDAVSGTVVGRAWLDYHADVSPLYSGMNIFGYVAGPTSGRRAYRLRMTWTGGGFVTVDNATAQNVVAVTL